MSGLWFIVVKIGRSFRVQSLFFSAVDNWRDCLGSSGVFGWVIGLLFCGVGLSNAVVCSSGNAI